MESSLESVKLNANRWEVRAKLGLDNTRNDHAWNKFQRQIQEMVAEIRNDILEKDRPGGSDGKFILAEDTSWRDAHQMTDLFTTAAGRLRQVTLERRNESGVLEKVSLDQVFNEKRHLDQWLIHKAYLALTRKKTRRDEAAAEGSPIEPSQSSSLPPTDESSSGVNEQPRSMKISHLLSDDNDKK